jgi:protein-tyrosine phosphatase
VDGAGLDLTSSLLEEEEAAQLELVHEGDAAQSRSIGFISFPIPDRGVPPSMPSARGLLRSIAEALDEGKSVAVHCRQGVGRSGLIAAGVLVSCGTDVDKAIEVVSAARGQTVPETSEQLQWIRQLRSERLVSTLVHR